MRRILSPPVAVFATFALVVAITELVMIPSYANNWGGGVQTTGCDSDVSRADNSVHTFYYQTVPDAMQGATNYIRNNEYDPTDVNTSVVSSSGEQTDVVVHQDNYEDGDCGYSWHPNGMAGLATCRSANEQGDCARHDTWYDGSWVADRQLESHRTLACHETGHTLGLQHRDTDCMADPFSIDYDLKDHNRDLLNVHY